MKRKTKKPVNKGWYVLRVKGAVTLLNELGLTGLALSVQEAGLAAVERKYASSPAR